MGAATHHAGDDFVVSGEPVDLVWMRNELESKLEINTTILGDGPGMSKVTMLNRKLCWHDGVGVSYEVDKKHAEAIIRETGASKIDIFENPHVQREQAWCARQNRGHCGEEEVGKSGHEGTTIGRTDFEPYRNHSVLSIGNTFDRGDIVYSAKELTADWQKVVRLERYLCQLETWSDTDWAGCKRTRRSTTAKYTVAGSRPIKMWLQNTSCCGSQFSGSRIVRLGESAGRNTGTHLDVQRPRHAHEKTGPGRCERSSRHRGPTRVGQSQGVWTPITCGSKRKQQRVTWTSRRWAVLTMELVYSRKPCRGTRYRATSTKLSSQFVQNEISVNYVGARSNGKKWVLPVAETWQRGLEQT